MKTNKIIKTFIVIFSSIILILLILIGKFYFDTQSTFKVINQQKSTDLKKVVPNYKNKQTNTKKNPKIMRILLLGLDESDDKNIDSTQRSDTIMLVSINKETNKSSIISIPRDTYVTSFEPSPSKINAAYAYGKSDLALYAVETLFNMGETIPYYIALDFKGLADLVNTIGGVDVNNKTIEFEVDNHVFPLGKQHLNGEEALNYARMRKEDPEGDYGRQKRQQEISQEIFKKLNTPSIILQYNSIFKILKDHLRTNITLNEGKNILENYSEALKNQTTYQLIGSNEIINETSYEIVDIPNNYLTNIENK